MTIIILMAGFLFGYLCGRVFRTSNRTNNEHQIMKRDNVIQGALLFDRMRRMQK
ncbi:hypothetical protein [Caudoviricetes sp.]|nr:hypothetical protein [Caudoviricetes sp.]